jgi:hypothetical protein
MAAVAAVQLRKVLQAVRRKLTPQLTELVAVAVAQAQSVKQDKQTDQAVRAVQA